jgi:tripartite ATP-independent transporter DctM subunit
MSVLVLFGSFFTFILLKVPIPFALGISSIITLFCKGNITIMLVVQRMATSMESFALLAIPLFVLTGELINSSGSGRRLVRFADALVGHITGGLAHANILASMFFGGISGAASADTAAIGSILIPTMSESGYSKSFSTIVTITSSPIGIIIPPSIAMVIYGWLSGVQIPRLFAAGFIPGVLVGLMLMILSYWISKKNNFGRKRKFNWQELRESFIDALPALVLPIIILGGIFGGIFTATEAAAVAVVYGLFISLFVYREPKITEIPQIFMHACKVSGAIILLIAMTGSFGWVMTIERIPVRLSEFFLTITPNSITFLFSVIFICLIVGCFLTPTSALVLLVPVLFPISKTFGIDSLHFGLVMISALAIGHVTPPVGLCLYVGSNISEIPISDLIVPLIPFFFVLLFLSILIAIFPGLVLFIPEILF